MNLGKFRFLNAVENVKLQQDSTYEDIIYSLCKDIAVDTGSISLSRMDSLGWHREIVKDYSEPNVEISIIDLQNDDVISVNRLQDVIGPRKYLKSIKSERLHRGMELMERLESRYCGWRPIKGDGNCYYRVVYFSLFEQLIYRKRFTVFKVLHDMFSAIHFQDEDEQTDHLELLGALIAASSKQY